MWRLRRVFRWLFLLRLLVEIFLVRSHFPFACGTSLEGVVNRPRLGGYSQARTLVHSYASAGQEPAIRSGQTLDRQGFLCL
jgi:hypothetical protein